MTTESSAQSQTPARDRTDSAGYGWEDLAAPEAVSLTPVEGAENLLPPPRPAAQVSEWEAVGQSVQHSQSVQMWDYLSLLSAVLHSTLNNGPPPQ